jgi:2-succinyl-5-enolpyruvyl-6-hydroxy-3-cyclohexene-1-carboxylate synthase
LGIPVLAEPTSGLRAVHDPVPAEAAPVRCGHWLAATPAFVDAHVPDVVIVTGRPVLSRPIAGLIQRAATVVVCDPLDRGWDPFSAATHVISQTVQRWAADLPSRDQRAWVDRWRAADATASQVLDAHLDAVPSELGTARDLAAAMPDGAQLVTASSLAVRHLNEVMRPRHGLRVLGNRGASGIDGFMSTAIGAALAVEGPTAALAGDLSVVHDLTGLVVGDDEPLPSLPVVVLHNDGGGIFDLLPYGSAVDRTLFRRVFATPHGLPFQAVALTLGHGWTHVDRPDELPHVLQDAWATPGITLIEVASDTPAETARHRAIQQAVADALGGA